MWPPGLLTATDQTSAYKILEDSLNLRDVRVYRTVKDPNGQERRVLDSKETTLASQKQQAVRNALPGLALEGPGAAAGPGTAVQ